MRHAVLTWGDRLSSLTLGSHRQRRGHEIITSTAVRSKSQADRYGTCGRLRGGGGGGRLEREMRESRGWGHNQIDERSESDGLSIKDEKGKVAS